MTDENERQYRVTDDAEGGEPLPPRRADVEPRESIEPFSLEDDDDAREAEAASGGRPEAAAEPDQDLEEAAPIEATCPQCGAILAGEDEAVCIRCGFGSRQSTSDADAEPGPADAIAEDEADDEAGRPLCRPGRGDLWLPAALAVIAGAILLTGALSGAPGLFFVPEPEAPDATAHVPVLDRLARTVQLVVQACIFTGCGVAGLFMLSQINRRPMGDLLLAATRMLGIVVTMRLAAFISMPYRSVEWTLEALVQAPIFVGLSMVLFTLNLRDALVLGACSLFAFLLLWLSALVLLWTTT